MTNTASGGTSRPYLAGPRLADGIFDAKGEYELHRVLAGPPGVGGIFDRGGNHVNVKAYGAKGDGVTDDTQAIRDALQALAQSTTQRVLYFPAGVYLISKTLLVERSDCVLRGEGRASVIKAASGAQILHMLRIRPGLQRVVIEDLVLDGNRAQGGTRADPDDQTLGDSENPTVSLDAVGICADFPADGQPGCSDIVIRRVEVRETGGTGVLLTNVLRAEITDCYVHHNGTLQPGWFDHGGGIIVDSRPAGFSRFVRICRNHCEHNHAAGPPQTPGLGGAGIVCQAQFAVVADNLLLDNFNGGGQLVIHIPNFWAYHTITGNVFAVLDNDPGAGTFGVEYTGRYATISGNVFRGLPGGGVALQALDATGMGDCTIQGNLFLDIVGGAGSTAILHVLPNLVENIIITHNRFQNCLVGIWLREQSRNWKISQNNFHGLGGGRPQIKSTNNAGTVDLPLPSSCQVFENVPGLPGAESQLDIRPSLLAHGVGIGASSLAGGDGVLFLANALAAPSERASGAALYAAYDQLRVRTLDTVSVLAPLTTTTPSPVGLTGVAGTLTVAPLPGDHVHAHGDFTTLGPDLHHARAHVHWGTGANNDGGVLDAPRVQSWLADTNGAAWIRVVPAANAVNRIDVANAATGSAPSITSAGADPSVSLDLRTQGGGTINLNAVTLLRGGDLVLDAERLVMGRVAGNPAGMLQFRSDGWVSVGPMYPGTQGVLFWANNAIKARLRADGAFCIGTDLRAFDEVLVVAGNLRWEGTLNKTTPVSSGSAPALPSQPWAYLKIYVAGGTRWIPIYT